MLIIYKYFDLVALFIVGTLIASILTGNIESRDQVLAIGMILYLAFALPRAVYYQKDEVYTKEQVLKLEALLHRAYLQSDYFQRKYETLRIHPYGEDYDEV